MGTQRTKKQIKKKKFQDAKRNNFRGASFYKAAMFIRMKNNKKRGKKNV